MAREASMKTTRQLNVRSPLDNVIEGCPTVPRIASQSLAMATKEIGVQSPAGWTTRYNRGGRVESTDPMSRTDMGASEGQGEDAPIISFTPVDERGNEPCQGYSRSLKQDVDDANVNLGTPYGYPPGIREPEPACYKGDGASVVVRGRESRPHGEGRQSDAVHSLTRTKPEAGGRDRLLTAQKQKALALKNGIRWRAGCAKRRTSGSGRGIGETACYKTCMALPSLLHGSISPATPMNGSPCASKRCWRWSMCGYLITSSLLLAVMPARFPKAD